MDGVSAPRRAGFDCYIIFSEGDLKAVASQLDKAAKG